MSKPIAIVMAGGKGTRMKSELPKVLCQVCERPMIAYVLDAVEAGGVEKMIVVVGYRHELVRETLAGRAGVEFAHQKEQLGTGHAVMMCRELLGDHDGAVLVVAGDSPLMESSSIAALLDDYEREPAACIIGTAHKEDPTGLGRVVRDASGNFLGIVEEKDATDEQRQITEVNMSYYVFRCSDLLEALDRLQTNNAQGEYYITDCPAIFMAAGKPVRALPVLKPHEALGINTVDELAAAETALKKMAPSAPAE